MDAQRICLFGGTFDPIHCAHLTIAEAALKRCSLDSVIFVPAANPPHKHAAGMAPYEDRFRMVELACAPFPSFSASRLEEGAEHSYTINTLERVGSTLASGDRLFFLIGSDAFDEIETWHRWHDVLQLATFIVVARPGGTYRVPENARIEQLEGLDLPVASTAIRARLAAGEPTPELPATVRSYIEEHGLYGATRRPATAASPSRSTDRRLRSEA